MKRLAHIILAAACCTAAATAAHAQESFEVQPGTALRAGADRMTIGSFRDSYSYRDFSTYTLEWDIVTRGREGSYSAAYNHPVFSIGLAYNGLDEVQFRSPSGRYSGMVAAYAGMSRDLVRFGPVAAGYDLGLGLSYSKACYHPVDNPSNWFFSSPLLFYLSGGGHVTWQLGPRFDLIADISVRHNSSARFAYPNGGLNYWGGGLSARYRFQDHPQAVTRRHPPLPHPRDRRFAI